MKRPAEMHLFADSARGVYIPQFFVQIHSKKPINPCFDNPRCDI